MSGGAWLRLIRSQIGLLLGRQRHGGIRHGIGCSSNSTAFSEWSYVLVVDRVLCPAVAENATMKLMGGKDSDMGSDRTQVYLLSDRPRIGPIS